MSVDLRTRILDADDLSAEEFYVEEWDATILLRTPTAKQRGELMAVVMENDGTPDPATFFPLAIIMCACDLDGTPLFTRDDLDLLGSKNGAVVQRVGEAAMRLAGLSEGAVDEGKDD